MIYNKKVQHSLSLFFLLQRSQLLYQTINDKGSVTEMNTARNTPIKWANH